MINILEYISTNYTLFLLGAIIILLAIIGSYADKTNFGQGKKNLDNSKKEDINKEILNMRITDVIGPQNEEKNEKKEEVKSTEKVEDLETNNSDTSTLFDPNQDVSNLAKESNVVAKAESDEKKDNGVKEANKELQENTANNDVEDNSTNKSLDEQFKKFDEMFDEVLPKKEIVSGDLLDEVNNISLDNKTQDKSFDAIPSLDNFELPEIKDLKSTDDDIWKF